MPPGRGPHSARNGEQVGRAAETAAGRYLLHRQRRGLQEELRATSAFSRQPGIGDISTVSSKRRAGVRRLTPAARARPSAPGPASGWAGVAERRPGSGSDRSGAAPSEPLDVAGPPAAPMFHPPFAHAVPRPP